VLLCVWRCMVPQCACGGEGITPTS
jgi:hypothetical protein